MLGRTASRFQQYKGPQRRGSEPPNAAEVEAPSRQAPSGRLLQFGGPGRELPSYATVTLSAVWNTLTQRQRSLEVPEELGLTLRTVGTRSQTNRNPHSPKLSHFSISRWERNPAFDHKAVLGLPVLSLTCPPHSACPQSERKKTEFKKGFDIHVHPMRWLA